MKRITLTALTTAITSTAAVAHPGHIEAAQHGHSHWLGYGIIAGITAIVAATYFASRAIRPLLLKK